MSAKQSSRVMRKLVRDKIPEEIASEGRHVRRVEVLGSLRDFLLRRKALEEIVELCGARGVDSLKEELADVFEILHALAAEHQISLEDVESIRIAKRAARGGFEKGVFIDYVKGDESTSQAGLFGPMDYVSVTKRIPRTNGIRMEEESLIRIPIVPSFYQEEFRVGKYVVSFTDREILVRIQQASDERQLVLFSPGPDFSDLSQSCEVLFGLLPHYEGLWKIYSHILLKGLGFPVPDSVVVSDLTPKSHIAVRNFCSRGKYNRLLLRHDRSPEIQNPPRGGYLFPVRNLSRELRPFIAQGRTLMLQEPLSPYSDLRSCNASIRKDTASATLEILGPGFDASDLNRGDITPHEIWNISCGHNGGDSLSTLRRQHSVDGTTYQQSVRKRLIKIGRRITGAFNIGLGMPSEEKSEGELIESARRFLTRQKETLLLKNAKEYSPTQTDELRIFASAIRELYSHADSKILGWRDEIIVSMSIVSPQRLVFWQIIWPERKSYQASVFS